MAAAPHSEAGGQGQCADPSVCVWGGAHSLQESRLVLLLVVGAKLDLALESGKLAGLVEGDGVGAVQDVITGLQRRGGETEQGGPPPFLPRALGEARLPLGGRLGAWTTLFHQGVYQGGQAVPPAQDGGGRGAPGRRGG